MICLVVMTDGRVDCIVPTIESFANLNGHITTKLIHDDSGDPDYSDWLTRTYPDFRVISTEGRQGFDGAYRSAHAHLRQLDEPYIFSTEDDFVIDKPVPLNAMASVLRRRPHLAQMALLRGPVNPEEHAAGGVIEQHPDDYTTVTDGVTWREHRRFFTTNPSLYRRSLLDRHVWPQGANSEGRFGLELFTDPAIKCAFWGTGVSVTHIGHQRVGHGY